MWRSSQRPVDAATMIPAMRESSALVNRKRIDFAAAAWRIHASFTQWRLSFAINGFQKGE
jgi:hypothetical protein